MPDIFANITQAPPEMLEVIANVLETRAIIPHQQEMLNTYLSEIGFPEQARIRSWLWHRARVPCAFHDPKCG